MPSFPRKNLIPTCRVCQDESVGSWGGGDYRIDSLSQRLPAIAEHTEGLPCRLTATIYQQRAPWRSRVATLEWATSGLHHVAGGADKESLHVDHYGPVALSLCWAPNPSSREGKESN